MQGERPAGFERQRTALEFAKPDLRSRQVGEDPDRPVRRPCHVTNACRRRREERWIAMREVEAGDIHPGLDEFSNAILRRWAERADELRAAPPAGARICCHRDGVAATRLTGADVRVAADASRCGG